MAAFVELYIDQGTDFSSTINLTDDVTNMPINVYGYSVTSEFKRSYYSANAAGSFVCTLSDWYNGEITLSLSGGASANIKAGRYLFDVKVKDRANTVSRVVEGIINILPQVTR